MGPGDIEAPAAVRGNDARRAATVAPVDHRRKVGGGKVRIRVGKAGHDRRKGLAGRDSQRSAGSGDARRPGRGHLRRGVGRRTRSAHVGNLDGDCIHAGR